MTVRPMKVSDSNSVALLAAELGYPCTLHDMENRFLQIEKTKSVGLFVLELENLKLVGFVQIALETPSLLSDVRAEVTALVVDGRHQTQGAGSALLSHAEAWAKRAECRSIRVKCNVQRESAHAFYAAKGYTLNKTSHIFTKTLE
jgi:GNAT superfamily N-acetyltransferase